MEIDILSLRCKLVSHILSLIRLNDLALTLSSFAYFRYNNFMNNDNKIEVFQSSNGMIEFNTDLQNETIWASLE